MVRHSALERGIGSNEKCDNPPPYHNEDNYCLPKRMNERQRAEGYDKNAESHKEHFTPIEATCISGLCKRGKERARTVRS